jgi:hypothetical protein
MKVIATRFVSLAVGLTMISFGANQIRRPQSWIQYIPSRLGDLLPMSRTTALRMHGLGNVSLGASLLCVYRLRMPWLMTAAWWAFVTPLCGRVDWRVGMRDASVLSAIVAVLLSWDDNANF